jgi:succinyl-diaminopimelate desuccinylase
MTYATSTRANRRRWVKRFAKYPPKQKTFIFGTRQAHARCSWLDLLPTQLQIEAASLLNVLKRRTVNQANLLLGIPMNIEVANNDSSLKEKKRQALKKIDELSGEAIHLLQQMIRIPSYNPPGNEKQLADFNAAYLLRFGMEVMQVEPTQLRSSNIASLHGSVGSPRLLFNSHLDTMVPGDPSKWTHPPLSGELVDGMIWGVGAKNMKSGMAAAMFVVRVLQECGIKLRGDLLITQTADEMTLGKLGLNYITKNKLVDADFAVYTECDPPAKVEIAHRGKLEVKITVKGYSTHISDYIGREPVDAIKKMAKVVLAIDDMTFTNWTPSPYMPDPQIVATIISGGHAVNSYADTCSIICDCRNLPSQSKEGTLADIQAVLDRLKAEDPELEVELEVLSSARPSEISPNEPIVRALQAAIKEATGRELPVGGVGSTSDARLLIHDLGIPTPKFMFPTVGSQTDEHESVEDYFNTIRVYMTLVLNVLA